MPTTRYKTIPRTVEAMQVPERGTDAEPSARDVAVWMILNGYQDPDEDPDDFSGDSVYDSQVLPEYGSNFLTFKDSDSEERTAHSGDWIVKGVEEWVVLDAVEFSHTFEPAEPTS